MLLPLFDHNPTKRIPLLTIALIVANAAIFWQTQALAPQAQLDMLLQRGFIPKRLSHVDEAKPVDVVLDSALGEVRPRLPVDGWSVYSTFLSMMFLHGTWFHLISNMWMLWVFGNNIEDRLGHLVFAGLYVLGGAVGTLAQWAIDPEAMQPVIGASGAVWAILGAYAVTYPAARVKTLLFIGIPLLLDLPALVVIGFFFCMDLFFAVAGLEALRGAAVAHWAHLGGCAAGVTLMPLLAIGASPPESDWRGETDELLAAPQRSE